MATKITQRTRGFFVQKTILPSWQVMLMSNEESKPIPYTGSYVVIPFVDVDMVRLTRLGNEIIARDPVQYRAGQPFVVDPPPPGCTYSLLNTGGKISIFQKRPIGNDSPVPTKPLPIKAPESLVVSNGKDNWYFNVEVLNTQIEWLTGFKFRKNDMGQFKQDEGQLYDWGSVQPWGMDTTQVEVPTDFAFISARGVIESVVYDVAKNRSDIPPKNPARAVLETLSGNLSNRLIKVGDVVHHAIFKNAVAPLVPIPTKARESSARNKKKA